MTTNTQDAAQRRCQECGEAFSGRLSTQIFCSPAHKSAFHNRSMKRGKVLMPLFLCASANRRARKGTPEYERCQFARNAIYQLASRWEREDKLARRPTMDTSVQAKIDASWRPVDLEIDD